MATIDELFDGSRVDRITAEARQVRFGRVLLTVIAAVLFGIGWITAKTFTVLWLAAAWSATAIRLGWQAGRGPAPQPPR